MRKIMSALTIAAVAGMLTLATAAPASALTGTEKLGCSSPRRPPAQPHSQDLQQQDGREFVYG